MLVHNFLGLPFLILSIAKDSLALAANDSFIYGVASEGLDNAQSSSFALTHAGWVGVTTYIDASGNYRVKSETLVAMSGITTGNAPAFPPGNAYGGIDSITNCD